MSSLLSPLQFSCDSIIGIGNHFSSYVYCFRKFHCFVIAKLQLFLFLSSLVISSKGKLNVFLCVVAGRSKGSVKSGIICIWWRRLGIVGVRKKWIDQLWRIHVLWFITCFHFQSFQISPLTGPLVLKHCFCFSVMKCRRTIYYLTQCYFQIRLNFVNEFTIKYTRNWK